MSAYTVIYAIVRQIPTGRVATYGQVAELAQMSGQARLVGYALYRATGLDVPWHRVINAKGTISQSPLRGGMDDVQRSLLEQEGIVFDANGRINLNHYRWQSDLELDLGDR